MDWAQLIGLEIPEGIVEKVECNGTVLWQLQNEPDPELEEGDE